MRALRFGLLVILLCVHAPAMAAERLALLIGNGKYEHIDPLKNPPNDVQLVAKVLERVGFKVTLLVDVSMQQMDDAAARFAQELDDAGENAVGVFYFAGHGVNYDGENWLIPVSARVTTGPDIRYQSVSANKILQLMEAARNATDIVVLDACRNNPFRGIALTRTRAVTVGMARMEAPAGSFIAYSTAPGAVAYDGDGDYSPFAEAFAEEVDTPGVSIGDMMIAVRRKVRESTEGLGSSPQTPWDSSSLQGRFAFVPGGATQRPPEQSVASPPEAEPEPARPSGELAFWTAIADSNDADEYDAYLRRYPNGEFADLARIRKERLSRPEPEPQETPAVAESRSTGPQTAVWYDDYYNEWSVVIDGDAFVSTAFVAGMGQLQVRGTVQGSRTTYRVYDGYGNEIGYGQGVLTDPTHLSYTSYFSNGALWASGRFHINHRPD